ncbi:hypothetical protein BDM02DRAFT_3121896 [Thelephora ganbajun]|uniref:Uncharacterized protein n=1 Tax=Thelephora ganbajun TaxID=370292 RepID=A0ACB6Z4F0_THEGA|nr:hypothetical protein BDM02DRAFT_3121896 [Thelephora ganbajun]
MFLVLPTTSALHPTSYLIPQPYEYQNQVSYSSYSNVPRSRVPLCPSPQQHLFSQSSAEELEEREHQRALAVISNHRRRRAEGEVAIHQQQQAEAARQQYLAFLATELRR